MLSYNYLTNVGGKLISLDSKEFKEIEKDSSFKPIVNGSTALLIPTTRDREVDKSKNTYMVLVPKDAPFVNDLQEKLDLYVELSEKIRGKNGKYN